MSRISARPAAGAHAALFPALLLLALLFWALLFAPGLASRLVPGVGFWTLMPIAVGVLTAGALASEGRDFRRRLAFRANHLAIGLASAVLLYLVFVAGKQVSVRLFGFAAGEIAEIYGRRAEAGGLRIALSLLLWIGPGEELFWRGCVQHRLGLRLGPGRGLLAAALLYAGAHLWAANAMLAAAALVCGLAWGALYQWTGSLWPGIISHALWDALVFVWLPIP